MSGASDVLLILDGLYPGSPAQLVAACEDVGAAGALIYAYRPGGTGDNSPAHVTALRDAGKVAIPVIVPEGDDSGKPLNILAALRGFGFTSGPVIFDTEPPNLPSNQWLQGAEAFLASHGFTRGQYGTRSTLGSYSPEDDEWIDYLARTDPTKVASAPRRAPPQDGNAARGDPPAGSQQK